MDAKEAIEVLSYKTIFIEYSPGAKIERANKLAVEALEKVPVLEAENAKLKKALAECAGF